MNLSKVKMLQVSKCLILSLIHIFIPYLDKVFNKVSSNLACYIEDLRQNKLLEEY